MLQARVFGSAVRDARDGQNLASRKLVSRARHCRRGNQEGRRCHAAQGDEQKFSKE
jgi:hypothetical protein